jgi:hypothetical protein
MLDLPKRHTDAEHLTLRDVQHDDLAAFGGQSHVADVAGEQQVKPQGGLPLVKDDGPGGHALLFGQCNSLAQLHLLKAKKGWHLAKS